MTTECIGSDPTCPCRDGDACHYVATADTPAWRIPAPIPNAVEAGHVAEVDLGDDADPRRAVLFYGDGTVRFRHTCPSTRRGLTIVCAPRLQIGNGHVVVSREPLTIVASVLCEDCGVHGWVTDGKWVGA